MEITGQTKVMFVLAHPIGHVRATAILNAHFRSIGKNIVAAPLHVAPEDLEMVVGTIRTMRNVIGFGTTIPHKIAVIQHLDEVTDNAGSVGAVNFTRRDEDGRLIGHNTDGLGFVAGLQGAVSIRRAGAGRRGRRWAGRRLRAGGGRRRRAAHRQPRCRKSRRPARGIAALFPRCDATAGPANAEDFDIVVNTTSVGMKEDDPLPIDLDRVGPATVVADVIMSPPVTRLLARAAERGCRTIGGKIMLDEQMGLVTAFLRA